MSNLRDTTINNNLNISSHLSVDSKIINNDILYPIITIGGNTTTRTIQVDLRKFNNNTTTNGRPKIHWWISNARWSYPVAIGSLTSIVVDKGINLEPPTTSPNTAILRTSISDVNSIYKITLNGGASSGTYYFMCAVQGIVYSQSFVLEAG